MSAEPVKASDLAASHFPAAAPQMSLPGVPAAAAGSPPTPAAVDVRGVKFNPEKHLPEKDPRGRWRYKSSSVGGKKSAAAPAPAPVPTASPSFVSPDPAAPAAPKISEITTETAIGLIQTALVLIGEEEGVLSEQEKLILRPPLLRVVQKYDIGEMPAELDLAVALAALVITRAKKPKTATFLAKARAWWVNFWFARQGRKIAAAVTQHAPGPVTAAN